MTESTLFRVIGVDIRALGPIYERSEYPAGSGRRGRQLDSGKHVFSVIGVDIRALSPIYERSE